MVKIFDNNSNIVAIATASGYAGVGVVRISGKSLLHLVGQLTNLATTDCCPRMVYYCKFIDSEARYIDAGIIIYFQAPHSFTGEDVIELQAHGSPVGLQMLIKRCLELGCVLAQAGEFSYRAYLNGKIDLLQAESIVDFIHADSEVIARGAFQSLQGKFSQQVNEIKNSLIKLRTFVEASLDFPEEDVEFITQAKVKEQLIALQQHLIALLSLAQHGVLLNNGAKVVIIGQPNVGKSSILNQLANEEIAIVTNIAGTTRDILRQKITIAGIALNLIDTAGLRDNVSDAIEAIGIEKAKKMLQVADLCLIIIDATVGLTNADQVIVAKIPKTIKQIFIYNKIDLLANYQAISTQDNYHGAYAMLGQLDGLAKEELAKIPVDNIYLSAKTGFGINNLRQAILNALNLNHYQCDGSSSLSSLPLADVFTARTRHLQAVEGAAKFINDAVVANWQNLELVADNLSYAHKMLSEMTGEFSSDDLLGEIFSKFCIGK